MRKNGKKNAVGRGGALLRPAGYTELSKIFGESVCTYPLGHRGRCRSQPFATKERYGCGSAACRYTSARQFAPFSENLRRIRGCPRGRQRRRPLQRLLLSPVGADDSVRPQTAPVFTGISGESVAAQRADVGIGPLHDSGKFVLPRKFRMQGVFTAIIQRQLLSNLVYRNRRRVPNRP